MNPLDVRQNLTRPLTKCCGPELSYARSLAHTIHVSIHDFHFPAPRWPLEPQSSTGVAGIESQEANDRGSNTQRVPHDPS